MTTYLILNRAQRDEAVAWGTEDAVLDPKRLNNQVEWILNLENLTDPYYITIHDFLASLPQREVDPSEYE